MNRMLDTAAKTLRRFGFQDMAAGICKCGEGARGREERAPNGMNRVTDRCGREYLCPVERLRDPDFVSEHEKKDCFDYEVISRTKAL